MDFKKNFSIPVILTIIVILFGNNWIPRMWGILFEGSSQHEKKYINYNNSSLDIKEPVPIVDTNKSAQLPSHSFSIINFEDSAKVRLDTLIDKNNSLDISKDYSIDELLFFIYDDKISFVKKYLKDKKEYLKLLDQKRIKDIQNIVSLCDEFGLSMVYFNTSGNMIITEKGGKFGFLSTKKERIWNEIFDALEPLEIAPLTYVSRNDKWGVIDANGKIIVPVEFDSYNSFFEDVDFFAMERNGERFLYNKLGAKISQPPIEDIERVSGEHLIVKSDILKGLIDLKGRLVLPIEFDSIATDLEYIPRYKAFTGIEIKCYNEYLKEVSCP